MRRFFLGIVEGNAGPISSSDDVSRTQVFSDNLSTRLAAFYLRPLRSRRWKLVNVHLRSRSATASSTGSELPPPEPCWDWLALSSAVTV